MEWYVILAIVIMSISILRGIYIDIRRRIRGKGSAINKNIDRSKKEYNDNYNLIELARSFEEKGEYDKASLFYLKSGQVYAALKMKSMLGVKYSKEIIKTLKDSDIENPELILRNLVNEVYYKLERPAMAIALLNDFGLKEEAQALKAVTGVDMVEDTKNEKQNERPYNLEEKNDEQIKNDDNEDNREINFNNMLNTATTNLTEECYLCKKTIKENEVYIRCVYCGIYGHYSHLGEYIKVKAECPSCKQRLIHSMYSI